MMYRLTININMEKYSERSYPWMKQKDSNPEYNMVDVDKYKFKKTQVAKLCL